MIGIGGIGISSLAQLYLARGWRVTGTNDNPSPQTLDRLRAKGVVISLDRSIDAVPHDADLYVYSDAWLTLDPVLMAAVRALGKPTLSYFEALGEATSGGTSIVVSGTHGKTTTTAMLAKVLIDAGKQPTVIAGSILSEYGSNFVPGRPDLYVIEGCEYRRHFLHLHPHILVITNIELDHTDYYKDLDDLQHAFREVIARVPSDGAVVAKTVSESVAPVLADVQPKIVPYQDISVPTLKTPGDFNRANARAAKAAALALDRTLDEQAIDTSLAAFPGTWRRFEYKGVTNSGALVYDDYAHHPTAVRTTLDMVRAEFPDKRVLVVFHPHLYSRTKSFFDEFVDALARADEVLLLPIYAAREAPDPTVSSEKLAAALVTRGTQARSVPDFPAAAQVLAASGPDTLILTMGAGDVYRLADQLVA